MSLEPAVLQLITVYGAIAVVYLLVIPFIAMQYINRRWNESSGWEKILMFFLAFFFFPGMILVGPFLNFRPQQRSV